MTIKELKELIASLPDDYEVRSEEGYGLTEVMLPDAFHTDRAAWLLFSYRPPNSGPSNH